MEPLQSERGNVKEQSENTAKVCGLSCALKWRGTLLPDSRHSERFSRDGSGGAYISTSLFK